MFTKLFLLAAIFTASTLVVDTPEADAQIWRRLGRNAVNSALGTNNYSNYSNRYYNGSYGVPSYQPSTRYYSGYVNNGSYYYPNTYTYGSNYGNSNGYYYSNGYPRYTYGNYNSYSYPSGYSYGNTVTYGYPSYSYGNYNNYSYPNSYSYGRNSGNSARYSNSGSSNYRVYRY